MEEYPCKVWSANRIVKKVFMSAASMELIIEKAHSLGLEGSKLVLECDGSEICSDDILEYYLKLNAILMLLQNCGWTERSIVLNTTCSIENDVTLSSAIYEPQGDATFDSPDPIILPPENSIGDVNTSSTSQYYIMQVQSDSTDVESDATTLAMSSSGLISSSESTDSAKQLFKDFQIPWQKVPSDILDMLCKKQKLGKRLNVLANILVDEMRVFSFYIPMGIFRLVMQQAVAKFPESLLEKDSEGKIISATTVPLLTIFLNRRNRNNFLNRPPNRKTSLLGPKIPLKERRRSNLLRNTCSNWQPTEFDAPETITSVEYKQHYLISAYSSCSKINSED